jgi:hypothetical protein
MPDEVDHRFIENLNTEYYKIVSIVSEFDKNLLTVKGWGVTLGLAALAWGFQNRHYGLFLIAAISGLAFWMIEAAMKRHQMRYYVRMREIEVISFMLAAVTLPDGSIVSSPLIDWSWVRATLSFRKGTQKWSPPKLSQANTAYAWSWFLPHVFLPHILTVTAGGLLFAIGAKGWLEMPL